MGHRNRACPLDGRCCRFQLPGHVARDCGNAWGSSNPTAPGGLPSTSRPGSGAGSQPPNTGPAGAMAEWGPGADLEDAAPVGVDGPVNEKIVFKTDL